MRHDPTRSRSGGFSLFPVTLCARGCRLHFASDAALAWRPRTRTAGGSDEAAARPAHLEALGPRERGDLLVWGSSARALAFASHHSLRALRCSGIAAERARRAGREGRRHATDRLRAGAAGRDPLAAAWADRRSSRRLVIVGLGELCAGLLTRCGAPPRRRGEVGDEGAGDRRSTAPSASGDLGQSGTGIPAGGSCARPRKSR
jgi:hypothetical protein